MIRFNPKRLPFLSAGLALALSCMPVLAEDKAVTSPNSKTSTSSSASKQVTLTGKVVDLHSYMTDDRNQGSSPVDFTPSDRGSAIDRTRSNDSDTKLSGTDSNTADSDKKYGDKNHDSRNNQARIMGLETSAGLVMICFEKDNSASTSPRSNDDKTRTITPTKPGDQTQRPIAPTTPGKPSTPGATTTRDNDASNPHQSDKTRMNDGSWLGKQVSVTGTMYEKQGVKFLVVSKIASSYDSKSDSKNQDSTTTPRPGTSLPRPE